MSRREPGPLDWLLGTMLETWEQRYEFRSWNSFQNLGSTPFAGCCRELDRRGGESAEGSQSQKNLCAASASSAPLR